MFKCLKTNPVSNFGQRPMSMLSNFDTTLYVYTGFENGFANLILVASNDDAAPGFLQSEVTFQVNAGQYYEIRVGGYFGSQGNIYLNGVVSNDDLFDSIDVTLPFSLTASNVGATTQPGEPALEITGATVWWYFEADINDDGFVNLLDVAPFVDLLTGG